MRAVEYSAEWCGAISTDPQQPLVAETKLEILSPAGEKSP